MQTEEERKKRKSIRNAKRYAKIREKVLARTTAYNAAHPEETKKAQRKWREANRDRIPHNHRKHRYGISEEEFYAQLVAQDHACGVCGAPFSITPSIDHDHACCGVNKACDKCRRGLLCARCNHLLGHTRDSVEVLYRAIAYLLRHKRREILEDEGPR